MEAVTEKIKWTTEGRSIDQLIPADYNPRILTAKEASDLATSLERFGMVDPIIINQDNKIIGGHQRYFIMKAAGYKSVTVRVPERMLDAQEERELNVRLNKNTGQWDLEKLADLGEEMLMDIGFSAKELDDIFDLEPAEDASDNDAPPRDVSARTGDLYLLGDHRLMCGDSTDAEHIKTLFAGQQVDMIFTDPPYNVDYSGSGQETSNTILNDNLTAEKFQSFIADVFQNMHGIMKDGAVYYICSGWSPFATFDRELIAQGFYRAGVIIWKKDVASMGWNDFRYKHEWIMVGKKKEARVKGVPILYGWKEGPHFFRDTRDEVDVWEVPRKSASKYKHPTEKPVWLVEKAIANSSMRRGLVADLFGGGGSTLIACERLKRQAFIMEKDPRYVDVQLSRWERLTGQRAQKVGA